MNNSDDGGNKVVEEFIEGAWPHARFPIHQVSLNSKQAIHVAVVKKRSKVKHTKRVRMSSSLTGPTTLRTMLRWVSSKNSTRTWVTAPREPVRASTLVTLACLMGTSFSFPAS